MPADSWTSLTVELPLAYLEAATELLFASGAQGVEVRDGELMLPPGIRGPKPGEALIIASFARRKDATKCAAALKAIALRSRIAAIANQDWSRSWRKRIRPTVVGRLWVGPPWRASPRGKVRIAIEPKMAFGTGDHPTTSLCLAAVDAFFAEHTGASMLDVGTGSGVLALAARKLGAGRTVGVDIDAIAVEQAQENALANGVEGVRFSRTPLRRLTGSYDLVVANILANTLVEAAPLLAQRTRQRLVLAGVLHSQLAEVVPAFTRHRMKLLATPTVGEWVRIDFAAPKR